MSLFAVVIPAYNEKPTIRDIAERALAFCKHVIVVDDGSEDGTSDQLDGLPIQLLKHETNRGKAFALWCGIQSAMKNGADAVVTIDADGQHRPEDIPAFLAAAKANPGSIVIGSRLHDREEIPPHRYWANRFANFWVAWAAGYPIIDSQSGFRLYPASLMKKMNLEINKEKSFVFESEVLIEAGWLGSSSVAIEIPAIYSESFRDSHFQGVSDILKITKMVAGRLVSKWMNIPGFYSAFIGPRLRNTMPRRFDLDALFTLVLSVLVGIASFGLTFFIVFRRIDKTARNAGIYGDKFQAIAVPGNSLVDGKISADYKCRLDRAAELYFSGDNPSIMLIGGKPVNGLSEAGAGQVYLNGKNIPSSSIAKEEESNDTLDNLRKARLWLQSHGSVMLISNRYHLERIKTISKSLGFEIRTCGAENHYSFFSNFGEILFETIYLHWYLVSLHYAKLIGSDRILRKLR